MGCTKRAAELHGEALFRQPPSREECPICFLALPFSPNQVSYKSCCGKIICPGCVYATSEGYSIPACPCQFCRKPTASSAEENMKRLERRIDMKDPEAMVLIGFNYAVGGLGLSRDFGKALTLFREAADLGSINAHHDLGCVYYHGKNGVEVEKKKAKHYWEIAAMGWHVEARYNLGALEGKCGNPHRAMKHLMISASVGCDGSLKAVTGYRWIYKKGLVTKHDFEVALRAHKNSQDEMKSEWRDKANVADQILKLAGILEDKNGVFQCAT